MSVFWGGGVLLMLEQDLMPGKDTVCHGSTSKELLPWHVKSLFMALIRDSSPCDRVNWRMI